MTQPTPFTSDRLDAFNALLDSAQNTATFRQVADALGIQPTQVFDAIKALANYKLPDEIRSQLPVQLEFVTYYDSNSPCSDATESIVGAYTAPISALKAMVGEHPVAAEALAAFTPASHAPEAPITKVDVEGLQQHERVDKKLLEIRRKQAAENGRLA